MPDRVKEKLIDLFFNANQLIRLPYMMNIEQSRRYIFEQMADHLIANGVTVQEWISVKDRLPEEWHTVLVFVPSIDAIIPAKLRGGSWYATWDTTRLEYVAYWMSMPEKPQPPKGE